MEISIYRHDPEHYGVELRFLRANDEAMPPPVRATVPMALWEPLSCPGLDGRSYGKQLTDALFADKTFREEFSERFDLAESPGEGASLRLRLSVDAGSADLHGLRWETLQHPAKGTPLATAPHVYFSRFLSSSDWRPIRLRARGELWAFGAVAGPQGWKGVAPINKGEEFRRAKEALSPIPLTPLDGRAVTLPNLLGGLGPGYDILYLVCHGQVVDGISRLLLEDEAGQGRTVPGLDLAEGIARLERPPRLVVLLSCQSAGNGGFSYGHDERVLAAVGPRLAAVGVPAVLAMQGDVTQAAGGEFIKQFFEQLLQGEGEVDRAANLARRAVQNKYPDGDESWRPVLFLRLRNGRLWYSPGFKGRPGEPFEGWEPLVDDIRRGQCTPILGPDIFESVVGPVRAFAQELAAQHRFPLAPHGRENMHEVAQFVGIHLKNIRFPRNKFRDWVKERGLAWLRRHALDELSEKDSKDDATPDTVVRYIGSHHLDKLGPEHPYNVLARLDFPCYVSTCPDSLLEEALRAAGRPPKVDYCRWNPEADWPEPPVLEWKTNPEFKKLVPTPLVYQFFGRLADPNSLVLTEDDYFDYLIGVIEAKVGEEGTRGLVPATAQARLANSGLLFLGFRVDDWAFRVFFRSIIRPLASPRWKRYTHVAIQVHPEEDRFLDPERAREYIAEYFRGTFSPGSISIYWGSVEDFIRELIRELNDQLPPAGSAVPTGLAGPHGPLEPQEVGQE